MEGQVVSICLYVLAFTTLNRGHQLGNSIAVLRQYHALGVRYVTLTHTCHNAFADSGSCGILPGKVTLHGGLRYVSPSFIKLSYELLFLVLLVVLSSKR